MQHSTTSFTVDNRAVTDCWMLLGSGLGRLMAERFGRLGCKLVLWDITSDFNEETADKLRQQGVEVHTHTCDVANADSVYKMANKVLYLFYSTVQSFFFISCNNILVVSFCNYCM